MKPIAIDVRNLPFWENALKIIEDSVLVAGKAQEDKTGDPMEIGAAIVANGLMQHIGIACMLMETQGVEGARAWFLDFAEKHSLKDAPDAKGVTVPGLVGHA